jgi:hypothetical protein
MMRDASATMPRKPRFAARPGATMTRDCSNIDYLNAATKVAACHLVLFWNQERATRSAVWSCLHLRHHQTSGIFGGWCMIMHHCTT